MFFFFEESTGQANSLAIQIIMFQNIALYSQHNLTEYCKCPFFPSPFIPKTANNDGVKTCICLLLVVGANPNFIVSYTLSWFHCCCQFGHFFVSFATCPRVRGPQKVISILEEPDRTPLVAPSVPVADN